MKRELLRYFLSLGILVMSHFRAGAQITTSYYISSNTSKFAVGYNFNDRYWVDARIYSGTLMSDITPEFVVNYNYIRRPIFDAYAGIGGSINYFSGAVVPVGIAIKPVTKIPELSVNIEFDPLIGIDDRSILQGFLGIRFILPHKEKKQHTGADLL